MEPTGPARVERRLAAILAADVAGYSRLIEADEEGTLGRLGANPITVYYKSLSVLAKYKF